MAADAESNASITTKKTTKKKKGGDLDILNAALASAPKSKAQKEKEAKKKKEEERKKAEEEARKLKEERLAQEEKFKAEQRAKGINVDHAESLFVKIENRLPDPDNPDDTDEFTATGLDAAVDLLSVEEKNDAHPERRRKALYNAYFESQLVIMKAEYPNLKLSQYKERIFEKWQSSPENPMNAAKG